jgi:hypothetical protein
VALRVAAVAVWVDRDWALRADRELAVMDIGRCSSLQVFELGSYLDVERDRHESTRITVHF